MTPRRRGSRQRSREKSRQDVISSKVAWRRGKSMCNTRSVEMGTSKRNRNIRKKIGRRKSVVRSKRGLRRKRSKGTPKQFYSAGEIQIWKDVCFLAFFPISLLHATNKLDIFFSIVCHADSLGQTEHFLVALSHCNT